MAGEYRILRKLGSGGFGTVYEAEHPVLKRKAAVKVLHPGRTENETAVLRFIEEARAASRIRHENLVDIFSFGTLPTGQHFYVMDLLEGAPLDRYADERGQLSVPVALGLLQQVALALDALHGAGIVHRDVKPANLFLTWDANDGVCVKLLDLGLIKLLSDSPVQTASGVPMGTPHYMSPEQCRGDKVDARADVYAFGVIAYELLTGRLPITGDSVTSILIAQLLQTPEPMSKVRVELPALLDEPVQRMLAKEADSRPSSAGAAYEELESAARTAGVTLTDALRHLPRPTPRVVDGGSVSSTFPEPATHSGARFISGSKTSVDERRGFRWMFLGAVFLVGLVAAGLYLSARDAVVATAPSVATTSSGTTPETRPSSAKTSAARSEPVAAAPSAVPSSVPLVIRGVPDASAVELGGRELGRTPEAIPLPRGTEPLQLELRAKGHEPKTFSVVPDRAIELELSLVKTARARAKPTAVPSDLENPF